jgi:hypothetical protein
MNWSIIFSQSNILIAVGTLLLVLVVSSNVWLWIAGFAALAVAVLLVFDRKRNYPALLWVVSYNWLGIAGAIVTADLIGLDYVDALIGPYRIQAILLNLIALIVFAAGIASSTRLRGSVRILANGESAGRFDHVVNLQRGVIAYFASFAVTEVAGFVVANIPQLQQPLIILYMLKFICIYLVAMTVFSTGRGYSWLAVLLAVEVVNGLTSFFGGFKEAFFLVLIALVATGLRPSVRMWVFGVASAAIVIMLSLVWTAVKPEYRAWVSGYTGEQIIVRSFNERLDWMADRIFYQDINYWPAWQNMIYRIDSTAVYAQFLARADTSYVIDLPSRYLGALEHVLMPRILFPDKASINDSEVTSAMTGRVIDENTSISIGYVAEAHYDFGIPWMFIPILLIGMMVGLAGRYFMTRNAPYLIRQAFATTALFGFFQFGQNFNKALGTFLVGFMVLALVLKFGYPLIANWLAGRKPAVTRAVGLSGAE